MFGECGLVLLVLGLLGKRVPALSGKVREKLTSRTKSSQFSIKCAFPGSCSQSSLSLEIQSLPLATSSEHSRNAGIGYDHGKDSAHGIQICLYDTRHGFGREDSANVRSTRVDDCDGVDARGKSGQLVQKEVAED